MYYISVAVKPSFIDPRGEGLQKDIHDLGIHKAVQARVSDVYLVEGELSQAELDRICVELLTDAVVQEYAFDDTNLVTDPEINVIEVAYNPGVMDPVEGSILKGIFDLGITSVKTIRTSKKYYLNGDFSQDDIRTICDKLLVNPVIQHVVTHRESISLPSVKYAFSLEKIDICSMGDDELLRLSQNRFWLNLSEMQCIQSYFGKLGRSPTDIELETLAQTWSEHCVHKTFRGRIRMGQQLVDNLLKSTIMMATNKLNKPWCLSVFRDNAGVIEFDDENAVCFKVETHNHPSAVEPYGGAATGIGGVVRDPLGTGMGAKPIANTDVFCFGPPDLPYDRLPKGVLHPRRIFKGVRAGVADYGNRLGIPTLNGAVLFDERYVGNPLVFCGTVGIMPKSMSQTGKQLKGDLVVVAGGRTGRDGIHGVTFASGELTTESEDVSSSSVQIGNPIVEKKLIDVLLKARDLGLYRRITDCGGGGLSSAVGEMGEETGVRVDLDKVPLKYSGLSYTEIWVSESQERMLMAVPPTNVERLLELFASEDVEATVIGEFTDTKRLQLYYQGNLVCDLDMDFLHHGIPQGERQAIWHPKIYEEPEFPEPADLKESLLMTLGSWNICSKEWVIRQYDHEVQGGSVLKPLVGISNEGPGDAAIIRPALNSSKGLIIANGINPKYSDIDPYWMAAAAIDEALRQVIAVGGNLDRVALLDNFCWGNPEKPDRLGGLVRAAEACRDMSIGYGTPFISGKDSLYNEYESETENMCIPGTLLISAIGVIDNVDRAVSMDCKHSDNLIYIVGTTMNELGGSHYFSLNGYTGNRVPVVDARKGRKLMNTLSKAIARGLVRACHDLSEGGLGVAAAEMAFAGGMGMSIDLDRVPLGETIGRSDYVLFSESNTRFLVEVSPNEKREFEKAMKGVDFALIGTTTSDKILIVKGLSNKIVLAASIDELKEAWQKPIRW